MDNSTLRITLQGADREPLQDMSRVAVCRQSDRSAVAHSTLEYPVNVATIKGVEPDVYIVRAFPEKHRSCGKFARPGQSVTLHCPVNPDAVQWVTVERDDDELEYLIDSFPTALEKEQLAGLLNVWAKLKTTSRGGEAMAVSLVQRVTRVKPRREMLGLARDSVEGEYLHRVSGLLHELPGYEVVDSFKTPDRYGNLQLAFLKNEGGRFLVDADVDEASGIGHLFQVLRNALPGTKTNPYDVHEILTFHQELDTGYSLVV